MTYEKFNAFCETFPATSYVCQWGGSQVWKVSGKIFAIGSTVKAHGHAYSFKTSEQNFYFLLECEGYRGAPYMASRGMKWIQAYQMEKVSSKDLRYYIEQSYCLVRAGLPKRVQAQLPPLPTETSSK